MHLSSVPRLISMHLSFFPCSLSHVFPVSCIPRLMLFDTLSVSCLGSDRVSTLRRLRPCLNIRIVSQIMSRLQATSRNQLCVTRIEIGDSWRNKMYIERAELLDQSLMRSVTFNPSLMRFSLYLLTRSARRKTGEVETSGSVGTVVLCYCCRSLCNLESSSQKICCYLMFCVESNNDSFFLCG